MNNPFEGAAAVLAHEAATQASAAEGSVGAAPQAARTRPIPQASPHRGGKRRGSTGARATPAQEAVIQRVEQVAHQAGDVPWPGAVGAKTTAAMRKRTKKKTAATAGLSTCVKKYVLQGYGLAEAKKLCLAKSKKPSRRRVKRGKMGA